MSTKTNNIDLTSEEEDVLAQLERLRQQEAQIKRSDRYRAALAARSARRDAIRDKMIRTSTIIREYSDKIKLHEDNIKSEKRKIEASRHKISIWEIERDNLKVEMDRAVDAEMASEDET